jgi:hypothetical protein
MQNKTEENKGSKKNLARERRECSRGVSNLRFDHKLEFVQSISEVTLYIWNDEVE